MIRTGQLAQFQGRAKNGVEQGDECLVLEASDSGAHVRWTTGARKDLVDLVRPGDLTAVAGHHSMPEDHIGLWSADVGARSSSLDDLDMWGD